MRASKVQKFISRYFPHFAVPSSSKSTMTLGKKLREAREEKKMSLEDVAAKLSISPSIVASLEAGEDDERKTPAPLTPGYDRLVAIAYARLLGLNMAEIYGFLPPPASLKSSSFIKNLSPLQQQPRRAHFMREKHHLSYSLKDVETFLWKSFKIAATILTSFYLWNLVRHLIRVIF